VDQAQIEDEIEVEMCRGVTVASGSTRRSSFSLGLEWGRLQEWAFSFH
jgi:molybdopterin-binding protein